MRTMAAAFAISIVIGSNRGIGLELCEQLHARGDRVVGVCRRASDELKGLGLWKVVEGVDVAKEEEVPRDGGQSVVECGDWRWDRG